MVKDFLRSYKVEILLLIVFFIFRSYTALLLPVDSDEVIWTIMADHILKGEKFYWYFANQNYTGSLEAYLISIFQFLFGINLWT